MTSLLQDITYALRAMRRSAGVTSAAVLSLAIGIGPNAAIFSVIDALGLRPPAITDPERLISITTGDSTNPRGEISYLDYVDIRAGATHLSDVAAWGFSAAGVSGGDHAPEIAVVTAVSDRFFPLLGVPVAAGRSFRGDETSDGTTARAVLISYRYWERRFARSSDTINSTIRLNTTDYTIVGVLPADFRGLDQFFSADIWVPFGAEPGPRRAQMGRDRRSVHAIARLRDTATLEQAQAELDVLSVHLAEAYPQTNANRRFVVRFDAQALRRWIAPMAVALLVIPGLVLLIACANVAGLMIGRTEARRAEIAVRLALGAGRRRLIRQFLTESTILALMGGVLGLLLGYWIVRLLPALIPAMPLQFGLEFRVDARVMMFTLAVTLIAVPVFGLAPAVFASRPEVLPVLKGEGGGHGRSRRFTFRNVLTVGQIAGSLVLLLISGLLVRSFLNSSRIDAGFVKKPMILSTIAPGIAGYDQARSARFLRQLLDRLSALPSVESATLARHMPLNSLFGGGGVQKVDIPGRQSRDGQPLRIAYNVVEENYFNTMGIRVVRGRAFTPADRWPGAGVVLINQTMAKQFWADEDPIGRSIELLDRPQLERRRCQIVGIVQDGKYLRLGEQPAPYLYVPFQQQPPGEATVIVATRGPEATAIEDFRRELRALDPAMPAMQIITLQEHMRLALVFERIAAILVGTLGGLALLLSVVGLYGVISYIASRRTREIGIRMALGARPADVLRQVLSQGGGFAAAGIGLGLVIAALVAGVLGSMLYGVSRYDAPTYAATCVLVMAVALAATYFPARRAARVDPIQALRCE
jgi:predicted permease